MLVALTACSPLVRDADFVGARDQVADVTLEGPFDGQVVDATTAEPIQGATIVGVWSYDQGDGLLGPAGSETVLVKTDQAGRYRIPKAPMDREHRGAGLRLVSFELVAYKRGYVAYRSDAVMEGGARTDFTLRQNRIALEKWRESDSHADHLLFLAAPPVIQQLTKWERDQANLDLYRALGGDGAEPAPTGPEQGAEGTPEETPVMELLDARALLPPDEVRRRTGYANAFDVKDLADLARTHFYHGVHLEAVDRDETFDVAYRVWKDPPGGLDTVKETFEATLPGVEPSGEITDQTWVFDTDDVRAVAFLDPETQIGLLLTCGVQQCVDIETAIILAKYAADHIDQLTTEEAPEAREAVGGPLP